MGRPKIEGKKIERTSRKYDPFCKRRENLFKKAHELAVLCQAEVAVIVFSADGKISEFASSNMEMILERLKSCMKSRNIPALKSKPEKPKAQVTDEVDPRRQDAQEIKSKQWKLLGKDGTQMGLHELLMLERQLTEGMLHVKDRKMQILMEQLEESRKQEHEVLQKNQTLQRLVNQLQGIFPPASHAVPLSVHFPETEGPNVVGPADITLLPSSSFAARLANENDPETEHKDGPADKDFFASTSSGAPFAIDNDHKMESNAEAADALAPIWDWWKDEDTRGLNPF